MFRELEYRKGSSPSRLASSSSRVTASGVTVLSLSRAAALGLSPQPLPFPFAHSMHLLCAIPTEFKDAGRAGERACLACWDCVRQVQVRSIRTRDELAVTRPAV